MTDTFDFHAPTGDMFYDSVPYLFRISIAGSSANSKVGGISADYSFDEGAKEFKLSFDRGVNYSGASLTMAIQVLVNGALAFSENITFTSTYPDEYVTTPGFVIDNNTSGTIEVSASLLRDFPYSGGCSYGNISFAFYEYSPPTDLCDCCCCAES